VTQNGKMALSWPGFHEKKMGEKRKRSSARARGNGSVKKKKKSKGSKQRAVMLLVRHGLPLSWKKLPCRTYEKFGKNVRGAHVLHMLY